MRLVSLHSCEDGLVLAKPVFDEKNRVLLNEGTVLSAVFINRLKNKKINHVYVKSEITMDIPVEDSISPALRFQVTEKLAEVFTDLKQNTSKNNNSVGRVRLIRNLTNVFNTILAETQNSKHLLNLLTHMQSSSSESFEHSINTSLYAISMGKHFGLKEKELQILGLGALFHDIGKFKEHTTETEWKKHPEIGFEILRGERELHLLVAHCAYQHHENVDGTGFPRGLKGLDIHLYAKIVSVAEAFDHLISKKSMLPHEAMEVIISRTYKRYHPEVVEAFKRSVAIYPIGVTVLLNSGETGVVIGYDKQYPQRPKVRIFKDKSGNKLSIHEFYDIDLMSALNVMIIKCDAIIEREAEQK